MTQSRLSIVTVTFPKDRVALTLQARSIGLFFDLESLDEIVVVNSEDDDEFTSFLAQELPTQLGRVADRLRIFSWRDLAPQLLAGQGWRAQQVLKLLATRRARSENVLILDSKNHFIRKVAFRDFVCSDGRLRTHAAAHWGHMRPFFEASFDYFQVASAPHIGRTLPTITPFLCRRDIVEELILDIERREATSLDHFFLRPTNKVTEFHMIDAYLRRQYGDVDGVYHFSDPLGIVVFSNDVEDGRFADMLAAATLHEIPSFAIHWAAVQRLTTNEQLLIQEFWERLSLIAVGSGQKMLDQYGRSR